MEETSLRSPRRQIRPRVPIADWDAPARANARAFSEDACPAAGLMLPPCRSHETASHRSSVRASRRRSCSSLRRCRACRSSQSTSRHSDHARRVRPATWATLRSAVEQESAPESTRHDHATVRRLSTRRPARDWAPATATRPHSPRPQSAPVVRFACPARAPERDCRAPRQ